MRETLRTLNYGVGFGLFVFPARESDRRTSVFYFASFLKDGMGLFCLFLGHCLWVSFFFGFWLLELVGMGWGVCCKREQRKVDSFSFTSWKKGVRSLLLYPIPSLPLTGFLLCRYTPHSFIGSNVSCSLFFSFHSCSYPNNPPLLRLVLRRPCFCFPALRLVTLLYSFLKKIGRKRWLRLRR